MSGDWIAAAALPSRCRILNPTRRRRVARDRRPAERPRPGIFAASKFGRAGITIHASRRDTPRREASMDPTPRPDAWPASSGNDNAAGRLCRLAAAGLRRAESDAPLAPPCRDGATDLPGAHAAARRCPDRAWLLVHPGKAVRANRLDGVSPRPALRRIRADLRACKTRSASGRSSTHGWAGDSRRAPAAQPRRKAGTTDRRRERLLQ